MGRPSPRCYPGPRRSRRWSSDHSSGQRDGRVRPARQEAPTAPAKQYKVTLTPDERGRLDALTTAGKRAARTITRARILLLTDQGDGGPGWEDRRVAEALGCSPRTVERVRERFVTDGLDAALTHQAPAKPPRTPVLDGKAEARLVALACAATPDGRKAWTLRMLADKLVELEVVTSVSHETVRRALKKTR